MPDTMSEAHDDSKGSYPSLRGFHSCKSPSKVLQIQKKKVVGQFHSMPTKRHELGAKKMGLCGMNMMTHPWIKSRIYMDIP